MTGPGSLEQPYVGVPDLDHPVRFDDDDIGELVGRDLTTPWFRVDREAHQAFVRSCFLDRVYPGLATDTVVEGFYLLSLLDPLTSGLVRHRTSHGDVLNYGTDRVRFVSTVREDDVMRLRCRVSAVTARASGGLVMTFDCTLDVHGREQPGMVATWLLHLPGPARAT